MIFMEMLCLLLAWSRQQPKAERESRGKELTSFCGMLIEQHEDEVLAALQDNSFGEQGGVYTIDITAT